MKPERRVQLAWFMLIVSVLGWPLSAFTIAADEPQFVLALSWLAITLTSIDVLFTADVRRSQDDDT